MEKEELLRFTASFENLQLERPAVSSVVKGKSLFSMAAWLPERIVTRSYCPEAACLPERIVTRSYCPEAACLPERIVTRSYRPKAGSHLRKAKAPSLVGLCLSVLGKDMEDIIDELCELAASFPPEIKMAMTAIARRKKFLNDEILTALAEDTWDILDISGSDVTDTGLMKVVQICKRVQAVDISGCAKITELGVSKMLQDCPSLETLRWGGCFRSEFTARSCLSMLKPIFIDIEEESWEELDTTEIVDNAHSLRWLVWPTIDDHSRQFLVAECPRITLNPKPEPLGFRGQIPREAFPNVSLDDVVVKDIDPNIWVCKRQSSSSSNLVHNNKSDAHSDELSVAEKFRLAFVERDARLAPKRAKNSRQHKRRAEREWMMCNTDAKSFALASGVCKSLLH